MVDVSSNNRLSRKVADYIAENNLLVKGELYLVALSGGADSTALLLLMQQLGYKVEAIHCNFHLRGAESDRDEAFCQQLCQQQGITFHTVHFDTREFAALHKVSIEMAARQLRYRYFEQLRHDVDAQGILVAHHMEDSVETVLINLLRGTGIDGLTGIKPKNGYIFRPLLCATKQEILDYLKNRHQDYVTDSTNLIDDATRNKIRLDVMPLLKAINPSVTENIARTASRLTEVSRVFNFYLEREAHGVCRSTSSNTLSSDKVVDETADSSFFIDIKKLKTMPSAEYLLFHILYPLSFNPSQIEFIAHNLDTPTGRIITSSSHQMAFDRGRLIIEPVRKEAIKTIRIPEDGRYVIDEGTKIDVKTVVIDAGFSIDRSKATAMLDAAKIEFPLTVRQASTGDRFYPFGMHGSKLVSDYLTDRKMTIFEKQRQMVVTNANGDIIWLAGERPDNRYCLTKESRQAITVRMIKSE